MRTISELKGDTATESVHNIVIIEKLYDTKFDNVD